MALNTYPVDRKGVASCREVGQVPTGSSLLPHVPVEVLRFLSEEIYSQQTQLKTMLLSTSWPGSIP